MTGDHCLALGGVHQTAQQAHGGRLARAVGSDQAEDLALRDLEIEMIHGGQRAEAPRQPLRCTMAAIDSSDTAPDQSRRPPACWSSARGAELSTSILIRYTSLTRSSCVWICLGVNSASDAMNVTWPS